MGVVSCGFLDTMSRLQSRCSGLVVCTVSECRVPKSSQCYVC